MVDSYDAVVYDLDGTVVRLAIDWEETAEQIRPIIRQHGGDADADDALDFLPIADEIGATEAIEPHLSSAERDGARQSERLPVMDELVESTVPVGICSLNCEAACRDALDAHGISNDVGAIVGRDSVTERKPHPEPLLAVINELGAAPERTLFIGDSDSDEVTARRVGTEFRRVP